MSKKIKSEDASIELEFRAKVLSQKCNKILARLVEMGEKISESKRLSVMFLGVLSGKQLDIRVRINSRGKAEIVFKRGGFHSHDRVEESQEIAKEQILGLVKCLSLFGFTSKVTERDNFDFLLPNGVFVTLVRARNICYVEFEKKTSRALVGKDKKEILKCMETFGLLPMTKPHFEELCGRLGKYSDWSFHGSDNEFKKIGSLLSKY